MRPRKLTDEQTELTSKRFYATRRFAEMALKARTEGGMFWENSEVAENMCLAAARSIGVLVLLLTGEVPPNFIQSVGTEMYSALRYQPRDPTTPIRVVVPLPNSTTSLVICYRTGKAFFTHSIPGPTGKQGNISNADLSLATKIEDGSDLVETMSCIRLERPAWFRRGDFHEYLTHAAAAQVGEVPLAQVPAAFTTYDSGEGPDCPLSVSPESDEYKKCIPEDIWNEIDEICVGLGIRYCTVYMVNTGI